MKRVCVFCGSSAGEDPRHLEAAHALGITLAREGLELVYGGSRMGLMGRLAASALEAGGTVIGVIPGPVMDRELAHPDLDELRVVDSMHARKSEMADLSDAFVALPGGLGTLESFCELVTWAQLGLHRKPCALLDTRRFYEPLVGFLDDMVQAGFLAPAHRELVLVETDPGRLVERMRAWQPPDLPRWLTEGQT